MGVSGCEIYRSKQILNVTLVNVKHKEQLHTEPMLNACHVDYELSKVGKKTLLTVVSGLHGSVRGSIITQGDWLAKKHAQLNAGTMEITPVHVNIYVITYASLQPSLVWPCSTQGGIIENGEKLAENCIVLYMETMSIMSVYMRA